MPVRPSMAAAREPASPPPAMTTSVCRNWASPNMLALEEKAQGTLKCVAAIPTGCGCYRSTAAKPLAAGDHGKSSINAGRAFATIAIYRIDNPLVLIGLHGRSAGSRRSRGTMPTQVMFERPAEDVLGADLEADLHAPRVPALNAGRSDVELSLHHDLDAIEADWRAFEANADCTVFQTFDWLSTWFRNIGVHEAGKPAIVIGRHEGTILFLMPFALEGGAGLRKITWLGSFLCNYNGPVLARDFSRRVSSLQFAQVWQDIQALLRRQMGHDIVDLEKMPTTIGEQANPFCAMRVTPNVS